MSSASSHSSVSFMMSDTTLSTVSTSSLSSLVCSHRGVESVNTNQRVQETVAPTSDTTLTEMTSTTKILLMTSLTWRQMRLSPRLASDQIFCPIIQFLRMVCLTSLVCMVSLLWKLCVARLELEETSWQVWVSLPCLPCHSTSPADHPSLPLPSPLAVMNSEDPGHSRNSSNR